MDNKKDIPFNRFRALTILLISLVFTVAPYFISKLFYYENGFCENPVLTELVFPGLSVIFILLAVIILKKAHITEALDFIWYRWERSEVIKAILLIITIPIAYIITAALMQMLDLQIQREFKYYSSQQSLAFFASLTVLTAILFPVVEEIFWRGCVQVVFERVIGRFPALLIQAALFGAYHFRPLGGFVIVFVLGLLAGLWRMRRRTLIPVIIAHIVVNSLWCAVRWPFWYDCTKINIKHNYVSEFIELSKPDPYDPNDDAREQYSKALRLVKKIPTEFKEVRRLYPTQWNSEQLTVAQNWVSSNAEPLSLVEEGMRKPYYWVEYRWDSTFKNHMPVILPDILLDMKHIVFALCTRAKLKTSQGQLDQGISDIETCSRLATHLVANKDWLSKLHGWLYYGEVAQTMRVILAHENIVDSRILGSLQNHFELLTVQENFNMDMTAEKFLVLDAIQSMFTDDGHGDGRIPRDSFKRRFKDGKYEFRGGLLPPMDKSEVKKWKRLRRRQTTKQVEIYFDFLNNALSCSPWQYENNYHLIKTTYELAQRGNPLIKMWAFNIKVLQIPANSRVSLNATTTILAILRYKADTGRYPDNLSELVNKDYLIEVPDDPYSEKPIVYKLTENGFVLYSLGADFDDDNGAPGKRGHGDRVFWPAEGTNQYNELLQNVKQKE